MGDFRVRIVDIHKKINVIKKLSNLIWRHRWGKKKEKFVGVDCSKIILNNRL